MLKILFYCERSTWKKNTVNLQITHLSFNTFSFFVYTYIRSELQWCQLTSTKRIYWSWVLWTSPPDICESVSDVNPTKSRNQTASFVARPRLSWRWDLTSIRRRVDVTHAGRTHASTVTLKTDNARVNRAIAVKTVLSVYKDYSRIAVRGVVCSATHTFYEHFYIVCYSGNTHMEQE